MFNKLAITFGTSIAILLINIAGGVLTARLLGPLGKGQLTAVSLWPSVLASIGNLGLVNAVVYFTGKENPENIKRIWSGSFLIGILQTVVFGILGFLLIPIFMQQQSGELIAMAQLFLFFIPLNIFTQYSIAILQGRLRIAPFNFVRFLVPGSYLIGIIILALVDEVTVRSCAVVLLLSNAITLLFELVYLYRLRWLSFDIHLDLLKKMMGYGFKSHIGNISSMLNMRLDQILMSMMLTAEMLGLYVVAVTISSGVNLITDAIATITFPTISAQTIALDKRKAFSGSLRLSFWCSMVVVFVMLAASNLIINLLFGREFSPALATARVLIIAASVSGMNMTLSSGLKGFGKPSIPSLGEVISLCLTGILLWILMPSYGILGAAIASLIAYACNCLYLIVYVWHALHIHPKEIFYPQPDDFAQVHSILKNLRGVISAP